MKNPKVEKAFKAMKDLGISHDKVKPALKHLLKVFDKNWEFIEAENYRALVDAIFDDKHDEEGEVKRKNLALNESEPPSKKVHVVSDEDEASSAVDITGMFVALEDDISPTSLPDEKPQTLNSNPVNKRAQPGSCLVINKGKGHLSSAMISSEKQTSERGSSSSCSKLPVDEPGPVLVDKGKTPIYCQTNKQTIVDAEQCEINLIPLGSSSKIQLAHSDLVEGSATGNISAKSSQCAVPENTKESGSARNSGRSECKFDIASRRSGDVKLSFVSAIRPATSRTPDIEAVLKSVEDKFMRSHKVIRCPFSLKNLLEELCESFFEMITDCSNSSLVRDSFCRRKKSPREPVALDSVEVLDEKKSEIVTSNIFGNGTNRPPHFYIDDVTKGAENVKIPLVDEYGNRPPPRFFYIPRNLIYQKAIVNISLARISDEDCCPKCSGDCLSSPVPCACARITNGEFAYTQNGLLKEEFLRACISEDRVVYCQDCPIERAKNETKPDKCKGHYVRRFIKECWSKCDCGMQCGNRVVQRGITRKLQVYWTSEGKGWGLRTVEDLPKGAFVCEYVGEVVTNTELDERNNRRLGNEKHTYPVHLDADWGSESILDDDFALCLDATRYGNVGRFVNHRCNDANLLEIPVEIETVDHHYYHIAFFTNREVKAFEELTWDYGLDFGDENHPIKAFRCNCGSTFCRDRVRKGSKGKAKAVASTR